MSDDRELAVDLDNLADSDRPAWLPLGVVAELERFVTNALLGAGLDPADMSHRRSFALGLAAAQTRTADDAGPAVIAWIAARPPVSR